MAEEHFSPVQPVLQQLHVLAGVLLQAAFCKERKGKEGVRRLDGLLLALLLLLGTPRYPSNKSRR